MVNIVLFSPGSVSSPYTNTGLSEKVNVFQVSPSFVLYLEGKRQGYSTAIKTGIQQRCICLFQTSQRLLKSGIFKTTA